MNCQNWAIGSALLLALVQLAYSSVGTPRITRVGRYLYDANGNRFYIKGVAFEAPKLPNVNRGGLNRADLIDPLADINACNHAIKNFKRLKINTIRVYSYYPEIDHSACMNALEKSGIYVIADINPPLSGSINKASHTWDVDILTQYIHRIDSLRSFPNLLAFNIGNEVITNSEHLEAGPYIKARARDVKLYLKSVNSTALVSYASADGKKLSAELARFLSCNSGGPSAELDLFGVNNYRWCGDSNFESTHEELTLEFQGLTIAAFLSEFGCLNPGKPRGWVEVTALFSTLMSDLWSGGVAYNYYPTAHGYGLVDNVEGKWIRNKDFENLSQRYHLVKPPNMPKLSSLVVPKQKCASTNVNSFAITSVLPPQPNVEACNCLDHAAFSCQVRKDASPMVMSELLDSTCKAIGNSIPPGSGEGCGLISSSPNKGVYGILSACSSATRLNYAMTRYFINAGLDKKACDFSGNATVQNPIKLKSAGEVDREVGRCFEINANNSILPNKKTTGASKNTPAQINSNAYKNSISGVRGQSGTQSSASSWRPSESDAFGVGKAANC
ncbi:uncharacterized protein PGTG_10262 [Puccinia graminis f. sp. tritici CRL 75-36-700-3]|uniref:1,3-beta-glucanosyltransferase n=2 Tax=Puccinia graminis f. sp. tritici TaxID=56615 RepID=E3KKG6_PUCGT|nr:uncharacterized protein PGTG_10262 [Puccinia graminis f. sp. tritici CRL 75-36-700-3]EFP84791.2 hypothetical protein PGTG_10262 [Puccinia graminis f. sp. tritici CRL 75-36-700-3]